MSFKNMSFPLSDEQKAQRQALIEYLLKHKEVIAFLRKYQLGPQIVEDHAYRFKSWIQEKERADSATLQQLQANPDLGEYVDLVYDGETQTLVEVYTHTDKLLKLKASKQYLSNYLVFSLPTQFEQAQFDLLDYEHEASKTFLKAAIDADGLDLHTKGLYLYGSMGAGKSHLAACITNKFARLGNKVMFVPSSELDNYLKTIFNLPYQQEKLMQALKTCDVLVLDDIGSEPITIWFRDEILFSVLNSRMDNHKLTIFTSNQSIKELEKKYTIDSRGGEDKLGAKRLINRIDTIALEAKIVRSDQRKLK